MTDVDELVAKTALVEAVNLLVTDSDAKSMFAQLQGVIEVASKHVPVRLVGKPALLNPLLNLAITDEDAYDRAMDLVNNKREQVGLEPLTEPDQDRRAYMREFMAIRRDRLRRLVGLWNELRSEHDKLRGNTRLTFEQMHGARWKDEKDRREQEMRAKLGRRLTAEERKAVSFQLWDDVEEELAALKTFVAEEMHKPLHDRSGFEFKVGVMPRKE